MPDDNVKRPRTENNQPEERATQENKRPSTPQARKAEQEQIANTITRKAYTVREVAELLGISRESVFGLLRSGELRSILIGKRGRRVTDTQLDAYLRSMEGRPPDRT